MTVALSQNRISYAGNGSTTAFSVPFPFQLQADLVVVQVVVTTGVEDVQVLNSDYTISGSVDGLGYYSSGGTVTMTIAPAATDRLVIYRSPTQTQGLDLQDASVFPAESVEAQLDKLTMICQRLNDLIGRAVRAPDGDAFSLVSLNPMPAQTERANTFLAFNANGHPIAAEGTSADLGPVTPYINTLLDDADAKTARGTLEVGAMVAMTRGLQGNRDSTTTRFIFQLANHVVLQRKTINVDDFVSRFFVTSLTLDALSAGPVAGGRDQAGAFPNPSSVYCYYIWNGTTISIIGSLANPQTGPTLPSGYTHWAFATILQYTTEFRNCLVRGSWVTFDGLVAGIGLTATTPTFVSFSSGNIVPGISSYVNGYRIAATTSGTSTAGGALDIQLVLAERDSAPESIGLLARVYQNGINSTAQVVTVGPLAIMTALNGVYYRHMVAAGTSPSSTITVHGYRVENGDA